MKIKVLVTGAGGQLGRTLNEISSNNLGGINFVFTDRTDLDITNSDAFEATLKSGNFDYCINCAAFTNVDLAETEEDKAIVINATAVKNIAMSCHKNKVTLIHISTDYVFDGTKTTPYLETDKTAPINVYGKSKLLGETYIKQIMTNYVIIRTSWLYSKFNKNFVKTVFEKLQKGENLNIVDSQEGTPTSCRDLSEFIVFLIENNIKEFGTYHFTAKGHTSWYGLGLHISKQVSKDAIITPLKEFKSKADRPRYSVLNTDKVVLLIKKNLPSWQNSVDRIVLDLPEPL